MAIGYLGVKRTDSCEDIEECVCTCLPFTGSVLFGMSLGLALVNHDSSLTSTFLSDYIVLVPFNFIAFLIYFISWTIAYIGGIYILYVLPLFRTSQGISILCLPANICLEVSISPINYYSLFHHVTR